MTAEPSARRRRALGRARRYPYAAPRTSYVLSAGRVYELLRGAGADAGDRARPVPDLTDARVRDPDSGQELELGQLPNADPGGTRLCARIPVLAYGANRTPVALGRKLASPGFSADAAIAVLRARLRDLDVVYSAHISPYGSVGATLQRSEGTAAEVCVLLLTETQLAALAQTEPNYTLERLHDVDVELDGGGHLDRVLAYVSRHGCLVLDGAETALAAIPARARRFGELAQPQALAAVAARTGHDGELDDFILANVDDPALAAERTRAIRRDARPLDWPVETPAAPLSVDQALEQSDPVRLRALRGAITVPDNDAAAILEATEELLRAVMERNALAPEHMVSCIFTATDDLDAEFPAVAARRLGLDAVPLLCSREISVPGSLPRVVRLMLHCYADPETEPAHVYMREAVGLRRDLEGAQ